MSHTQNGKAALIIILGCIFNHCIYTALYGSLERKSDKYKKDLEKSIFKASENEEDKQCLKNLFEQLDNNDKDEW